MTDMPDYKIYEVTWIDAWQSGPQYYRDGNDYTPMICKDIGYVMEENEDCVVMATSISLDSDPRHINVIPWEFVVHMEELV